MLPSAVEAMLMGYVIFGLLVCAGIVWAARVVVQAFEAFPLRRKFGGGFAGFCRAVADVQRADAEAAVVTRRVAGILDTHAAQERLAIEAQAAFDRQFQTWRTARAAWARGK